MRLHQSHYGCIKIAQLRFALWCLTAIISISTTSVASGADAIDFNRDIRPILSKNCFACHGPDATARQADLRLDLEASATEERDGHATIVPGNPDKSELICRITSDDDDERMPPADSNKHLKPGEIELLKKWITEGAKWSLVWAYIPPRESAVPTVKDTNWPINAIDNFILARLAAEGLQPSPEADKTTLVRRLYIDLIGLPPAPDEVDAFVADGAASSYERLLDRLLASPHYGERMAMYWLDLVRYADTVGYHGDQEHHISPYRDWVISSLNANKPFDQFTREQLAGDLLPGSSVEQKTASGYNRVLQTSHEGGVQPKEYLAIYAADHVRNLSAVWMGATLGCAQCHDHKYDPYTTRDFYSMAAFFADIDEAQHLTRAFDISPTPRYPELELLTPNEEASLTTFERQHELVAKRIEAAKAKADKTALKSLEDNLAKIAAEQDQIHQKARRTMITIAIKPRVTRILPRGNWLDETGPMVEPAIPSFLGQLDTGGRRATRLDLANWLTDSETGAGGLTARVMVNRMWYLLLGRGLSPSLDDFGGQGQAPDHPELLDMLAREFVRSGWNIKHMMKMIATSRTYRQSSQVSPALYEKDPLNRLVARQNRYRYPAESVRDASLSISGLLVPTVGGPSIRPYQPAGYYRHLNFPIREYEADKDQRQWRRGVYMHWQRQYLHPMLKAFDAPSREECTVERPRSNTAPAALVLLNGPSFVESARAFASRILQEGGATTDERINFAFRQAMCRSADPTEQEVLQKLLAQSQRFYSNHTDAATALLKIGLSPVPKEIDKTELASWTIIARTILNLNEVITRY
jgi:Protein of unknown function (DUF1553)/Protein of unknown function (DUF1549)/Planctomycete cytochrome C